MSSPAPSLFFSVSSLSIIYYAVGDAAFSLIWLVLSYELIKQLLHITLSIAFSSKCTRQRQRDAAAQATASSIAAQLQANTNAEIERLNAARASLEQERVENIRVITQRVIEEIVTAQEVATTQEFATAQEEAREEQEALEDDGDEAPEVEAPSQEQEDAEEEQREAEADALNTLRDSIPEFFKSLDPFESEFTCVGTTNKGFRCGQWMISDACKRNAQRRIERMLSANPGTCFELSDLRRLASDLLCRRWHKVGQKSQINEVARHWYNEFSDARKALDDLEDVRAWGIELQEARERIERRQQRSLAPHAFEFGSDTSATFDFESESQSSRTLSRSPSRSPIPSISAASSPDLRPRTASRRSSLSIGSDETPSDGESEGTMSKE
ncbi:hypothetical protein NA57DRAFT_80740 [Rhizodiscina lignyota]|uniref:Uncharacterized protein n=1 Tax=Rhizodiscina lignyota TaxID=1504668 RepID=A0A9P4I5P3_9PEZI|nr:hypothetical protein NA57DRAFT_80740 [Rhizodiscina lignyota]